ncbi:hypothetical protein Hanom_Chr15g01353441 [Helianthus anomalus]
MVQFRAVFYAPPFPGHVLEEEVRVWFSFSFNFSRVISYQWSSPFFITLFSSLFRLREEARSYGRRHGWRFAVLVLFDFLYATRGKLKGVNGEIRDRGCNNKKEAYNFDLIEEA